MYHSTLYTQNQLFSRVNHIHNAAYKVSGHYIQCLYSIIGLHGMVIGHIMAVLTPHLQNLIYEVSNLLNFRHKKTHNRQEVGSLIFN